MTARYWFLQNNVPTPCSKAVHEKQRNKPPIERTEIEPGFVVRTDFVGVQYGHKDPVLFVTTLWSDMGSASRYTSTLADATKMHRMEVQRISHIVATNKWTFNGV